LTFVGPGDLCYLSLPPFRLSLLHLCVESKECVWILFDNIDKGFTTRGLQSEDVYIIRSLLEATRKLQANLEKKHLNCVATVFLRRDVYDHLIDLTPDRGKETIANLDWSDIELVKELLLRRFQYQVTELEGGFEEVWSRIFNPHVRGENSFSYIISRTFLRPRDILNFVRKCIQVAVSRNHERVEQDDILNAEYEFSEDMLNELRYEMRDIFPELPDLPLLFIGSEEWLTKKDIDCRLIEGNVSVEQLERVKEILLWFSFLGIKDGENEYYSYQFLYNLEKLRVIEKGPNADKMVYSIHPAFRLALSNSVMPR